MKFLHRINRSILLLLLASLGVVFTLAQPAFAETPSAITLRYFRAVGLANGIRLEWATGSEFNTAGFRIQRASSASGPFSTLNNVGFVEAEGDGASGAEYDALDNTTTNGDTYWYLLVEVETDNSTNEYGPQSAQAGVTATPTSQTLATSTPGQSTSVPTSTRIPTNTPLPNQPGNTNTPAASPTAQPSNTPLPSVTPTASNTPIPVGGNPTATPFQFPSPTPQGVSPTNTPVSIGQAGTSTPIPPGDNGGNGGAYPGAPDQGDATPTTDGSTSYPGKEAPTPGRPGTGDGGPTGEDLEEPAGDSSGLPPINGEGGASGGEGGSNQGILWGGFVVAFGFLAGGIYLAIRLYSRNNL